MLQHLWVFFILASFCHLSESHPFSFERLKSLQLDQHLDIHCRNVTGNKDDCLKLIANILSTKTFDLLKQSLPDGDVVTRFNKLRNYAAKHKLPKLTAEQKQQVDKVLKEIGKINEEQSKPDPDEIFEQNQQSGISELMLESDIFPSEAQLDQLIAESENNSTRKKRNAAKWQPKWTDGLVYYEFSPEIAAHAGKVWMINAAHQYIQQSTCIKFQMSTTAQNRINIINNGGCYSSIGMVYGVQPMSLADGCGELHGTIIHETMHALGFWHTQSRTDRDDWLTVTEENADPNYVGNIMKVPPGYDINYTPYEYGSVMHYPPNLWAKAGTLTFVPKYVNYVYTMGSRIVTFYDMKMINDHYGCHAKCPAATSAPCSNGGYPNPNNCQECVCPPGYGGGWCMRQPDGCFAQLTATTAWKSQFIQIGQNNNVARKQFTYCTHWIKAPAKAQIQVKMTAINNAQCNYGCQTNGFEIKLNDQRMHGIRICCPQNLNKVYAGSLNPMPIISHNRQGLTSYTIQYRYDEFETGQRQHGQRWMDLPCVQTKALEDNEKYLNKLYVFDFLKMTVEQYKMKNGSKMQEISSCYWLNDTSIIIITQRESSILQNQYHVDHTTKKLNLINSYEHKIPATIDWFNKGYNKMHSVEIQGTRFVVIHRKVGAENMTFCLLPYYMSDYGPKLPVTRLQINFFEKNGVYSMITPNFTHDAKIYFGARMEPGKHLNDTYFCCDLNNISLTKTDLNFITNASLHHVKQLGPHSSKPSSRCEENKNENIVTFYELVESDEQLARIWILDMIRNTIREHPIRAPQNCDSIVNHNGVLFAVHYPSRYNSKKEERNILRIKILPGGLGTIPDLKELCSANILQNEDLLKKSSDLNHILFN